MHKTCGLKNYLMKIIHSNCYLAKLCEMFYSSGCAWNKQLNWYCVATTAELICEYSQIEIIIRIMLSMAIIIIISSRKICPVVGEFNGGVLCLNNICIVDCDF